MLAPKDNVIGGDIRSALAARLDQSDRQASPALLRVEFDTQWQPWAWLRRQDHRERLYWRNRAGDLEVAAVGVAHAVVWQQGLALSQALATVQQYLCTCQEDINYYGGMAFDRASPPAGVWRSFSPFYFAVPRLELRCHRGRRTCALNLKFPEDESILSELLDQAGARFSPAGQDGPESRADVPLSPVVSRQVNPERAQWTERVHTLLRELDKTQAKLVLACRERICFQAAVDALEVLERIRSDRNDSYGFLFSFGQSVFLGMSPEQLYERQGRVLRTEALAGTGRSGAHLQASAKENAEHDYVVRDISEALAAMGLDTHEIPPKELVHWNRLCHLRTQISAGLPEHSGDAQLLKALHPSAAVLGYPRNWARARLQAHEPLERGWYAGPVGRIGRDTAEFAVAIRSALVRGKILDIYAGAGIVSGSDPDLEWDEVRSKTRQFHEALGLRS